MFGLFSKDKKMSSAAGKSAEEVPGPAPERPMVTPEDIGSRDGAAGEAEELPVQPHYNPYIWPGAMEAEAEEGTQAHAGTPKAPDEALAERAAVEEALREVYDPEIPVNIYDLGLIYSLEIAEDGTIDITMTLTAPACPVAGTLPGEVARTVAAVPGTGEVTVTLTWDPPWDKDKMSEDAKLALGIY